MTPEDRDALRAPFPANAIGQLPKPKSRDAPKGPCDVCGGWHGLPAVHLDYVGHAATTDRLLTVDPDWTWEPYALDERGLPALDREGNLWIRLTVCGVTRPGVGDGMGLKEKIGDALRNAAMRFGVALDLWTKEDLHNTSQDQDAPPEPAPTMGRPKKAAAKTAAQPVEDIPPPPDDTAPPKVDPRRTRHVMAMFSELGYKDRPSRLARTSSIVGHDVGSWNDVTPDEADQVVDALERERSGR